MTGEKDWASEPHNKAAWEWAHMGDRATRITNGDVLDLAFTIATERHRAEQAARENEAEEIAKALDDWGGACTNASAVIWIRQRHAPKKNEPVMNWSTLHAEMQSDTRMARADVPHWSSLAFESRIRDIVREEILPFAESVRKCTELIEQLADARLEHAKALLRITERLRKTGKE